MSLRNPTLRISHPYNKNMAVSNRPCNNCSCQPLQCRHNKCAAHMHCVCACMYACQSASRVLQVSLSLPSNGLMRQSVVSLCCLCPLVVLVLNLFIYNYGLIAHLFQHEYQIRSLSECNALSQLFSSQLHLSFLAKWFIFYISYFVCCAD